MPKDMVNIPDLLSKPLTVAAAEQVVKLHSAGTAVLDASLLASLYAKEITARATARPGNTTYETLASVLADHIKQSFTSWLSRLTKVGIPRVLLLGSKRDQYNRGKYREVTVPSIHEKLPYVIEKIHSGDLTRFVHLITSDHVYGACVLCAQIGSFTLLGPLPGKMRMLMDTAEISEIAGVDIQTVFGYPSSFMAVAGFCWKGPCLPHCLECNAMAPVRYDYSWLKFRREDGLCPKCAARMLVNIQRPVFKRWDRTPRKLIIE